MKSKKRGRSAPEQIHLGIQLAAEEATDAEFVPPEVRKYLEP